MAGWSARPGRAWRVCLSCSLTHLLAPAGSAGTWLVCRRPAGWPGLVLLLIAGVHQGRWKLSRLVSEVAHDRFFHILLEQSKAKTVGARARTLGNQQLPPPSAGALRCGVRGLTAGLSRWRSCVWVLCMAPAAAPACQPCPPGCQTYEGSLLGPSRLGHPLAK